MSWYSGNQLTPTSSGRTLSPSCMMHLMLAARFACVSVTPFGREVEPLVNWRKQTSSIPIFSGLSGSSDSRMPSTATTSSSDGQAACTVPRSRLILLGVTRMRAPLLATMWRVLSR